MEHKIRILIDLASRAEHLSRELLQTARGRGKVVFRDEARGSKKKHRAVREIDFTFAA